MKHLRIFILLLLAVLIPIRGAVAATMLCPEGERTGTSEVMAEHEHHGMQADHAKQADNAMAHHHASADASDDDASPDGHPATCHFCASGCCMASMVGSIPTLGQPVLTSQARFPALIPRIAPFQSGGQDRPPRTI